MEIRFQDLDTSKEFIPRHIGPSQKDISEMLSALKVKSLQELSEKTLPSNILKSEPMSFKDSLGGSLSENETLKKLKNMMSKNQIFKNYIGLGFYGTLTPSVILRNVLENPSWYTQYTPYQAEISQGRLEALLHFQTLTAELTGFPIANASLLDEATACAEAMTFCLTSAPRGQNRNTFFIDQNCHPQNIEVVITRAKALDLQVQVGDFKTLKFSEDLFGILLQYPNSLGEIEDYKALTEKAHENKILVAVACDLMALMHLTPPGEWGADLAIGSTQRFGVPMGYGGPHAGFFATTEEHKRKIPGRIVGVSKDRLGNNAIRLALQTREQHIRRDKATSNICTAQALPGILATMYAIYHGPEGLKAIAKRIHAFTKLFKEILTSKKSTLKELGSIKVLTENFFDTLLIQVPSQALPEIQKRALQGKINLRFFETLPDYLNNPTDDLTRAINTNPSGFSKTKETLSNLESAIEDKTTSHLKSKSSPPSHETSQDSQTKGLSELNTLIGISFDETTTSEDLENLLSIFGISEKLHLETLDQNKDLAKALVMDYKNLNRKSSFLTQEVFNSYHSETEMLRFMKRLQDKDLSLTTSMIPLGSCTMKLNATTEMIPITWPEVSSLHPFVPLEQAQGYSELFNELEKGLSEITDFDGFSLQPNAGSQGEYSGLLVIKKYFESLGESHRNICLIPVSAHGTNPASAVMAGFQVKGILCDENGNIDFKDLRKKAQEHKDNLAAIMVTYPSTHGVFEEGIKEICEIIHASGGQVYFDGANMNAMVGLSSPGIVGADVCHLNLHKTFCIPHGGGGPGMGPIGVRKHLVPFLPKHSLVKMGGEKGVTAIAGAPWGSASILPISWAYLQMMGEEGFLKATQVSILNANYIAEKLNPYFPVLYRGKNNFVAHECIIDLRSIKDETGITVEDVAKRLMDYGYHAPTMSWPVVGTLMIEPTESESKAELDRFCDAMISIYHEIEEIKSGKMDRENNPLKNAPHTMSEVISSSWDKPYTREKAAFAQNWILKNKFWPSVARVDNALGDKNLICTCDGFFDE